MSRHTWWAVLAVMSMFTGCSYNVQFAPNPSTARRFSPDEVAEAKQISIFFDGTSNNWRARTNVRRSFEQLGLAEDPHYPSLYVEGVGTKTAIEKALGLGMKDRVIDAYCFLAKYWSSAHNDRIRIFGFSRGAFEARMLTGMMAHCGLPDATNLQTSDKKIKQLAREVYKYCENHLSDPYQEGSAKITLDQWQKKLAANQAELQSQSFCKGWVFHNPSIQLLGIWDTVPGLPFTKLRDDGEVIPGKPQRYKVRPYPNTKLIVHALSLDEKRSQFHPLIVGPPIDPANKVYEVWFPGAHSDIGGGYSDSNDMAGTSLAWMDQVLQREKVIKQTHSYYRDAHGTLHHPEEDAFSSIGSHSQARQLPCGSHVDFSVFKRANLEPHPEVGRPEGAVYEPTLTVAQPDGSIKTLKIVGTPSYKPADAKRLLQSVGLDLYDPTLDIDNRPEGTPLTLSQMNVEVKDVPKPPETKPSGVDAYPQ